MPRTWSKRIGAVGLAAVLTSGAVSVHAAATITIVESGGNTTATVSGSINTAGLTCGVFSFIGNAIEMNPPTTESVRVNIEGGAGEAQRCDIDPITVTFGTDTQDSPGNQVPDSTIGTAGAGVGVFNSGFSGQDRLLLPNGYVSGSPLSGSSTWNGRTLVSLGLDEGVFVITLPTPTGAPGDTLTLDISRQDAPPQTFNVTASVVGGNGSVGCNPSSVSPGESSQCTAVPDSGFQVSGWTGDCSAAGTSTVCDLTNIQADQDSTVSFEAIPVQNFSVTAMVAGGSGSVSCNPTSVPAGGSSQCTAVPDSGFQVSGWTGDCSAAGTSTVCDLTNIQADQDSTVSFQAIPVMPPPATAVPIPVLSRWGLLILGLLMVSVVAFRQRW